MPAWSNWLAAKSDVCRLKTAPSSWGKAFLRRLLKITRFSRVEEQARAEDERRECGRRTGPRQPFFEPIVVFFVVIPPRVPATPGFDIEMARETCSRTRSGSRAWTMATASASALHQSGNGAKDPRLPGLDLGVTCDMTRRHKSLRQGLCHRAILSIELVF